MKPLTVICSDEPLLTQEAVDAWRQSARQAGFSEREVMDVESRFNWASLRDAQNSRSLFGDKKIIEIRIPSGKPGKEGGDAIKAMCNHLSDDVCIMVTLPKLDKTSKNAVWFKALQTHGEYLEINSLPLAQLPRFIAQRLKKNHQTASPAALQLMAQQFEGNLIAAHQEIQKLALLFPSGPLEDKDIQKSIFNVARYDIFSLSEALLAGDAARVCRILEGLHAEGEAIVLILWALMEDVRILTSLKIASQNGGNIHHLMREKRVWGIREKLMPSALHALTLGFLKDALTRCAELDQMAKGLKKGDVWEATLQLSSQIALKINPPTMKHLHTANAIK